MTNLLLLVAAAGAMASAPTGPIRIDGTGVTSQELLTTGTASVSESAVVLGGGRISLTPAKQKALDTYLTGKPLTLMLSIVDTGSADTTAMTFGTLRLMEKDKGWYLVNNPEGEWHQVDLGKVVKDAPLRFALVAQDGNAHIWKEGKDVGAFPYKPGDTQVLNIGSPDGEPNTFRGEVRLLDITPKPITAEDIAKRLNPTPTPTVPTPATPTTTPTTTPPANSTYTKSTVVEVTLVDLSEVPDPDSILPYRHALVVQEYKINSVKSGNLEKAGVGATIRVARWGIIAGKKTPITSQKKGDVLTLTLEKVSDHPTLDHQYTVDTLPSNYTAAYLLDMSMTAPSG